MSAEFKPFFVDVKDFAGPVGRYLVLAVLTASSPTVPDILTTLLAVHMESKAILKIPVGAAKFVGFRGDCLMCEHRNPEEA